MTQKSKTSVIPNVIRGWKVFDKNLQCRGFQFVVGETFKHDGPVRCCYSGFHFHTRPYELFNYYTFDPQNRVCEVEATGEIDSLEDKSACSELRILKELSWLEVLQLCNIGKNNTGRNNSGNRNSGNGNSGHENSGNGNSASNSCGLFCTKTPPLYCFNKECDPKFSWEHPEIYKILSYGPSLTKFIYSSNMTDTEKVANPSWETVGGYLKTIPYKDAWIAYWNEIDDQTKQVFLSLPNFDAAIFEEITGIKV